MERGSATQRSAAFVPCLNPRRTWPKLVVHGTGEEAALPPVDLEGGKLVTLSWSRGMAAVVGGSLVAWPAGARSVTRLLEDEGLRSARDGALVAPGRLVVARPDTLTLVTDRGIAILALIRVRWADNALFVLDESWERCRRSRDSIGSALWTGTMRTRRPS
jgi:hypothetical protein